MCDKCELVDRALHGGLADLEEIYSKPIRMVHNGGYWIIIDNPTADGYMGIDKQHGRGALNISQLIPPLRFAMAEAAEGLFPNHYLDFRPKSALEHFCFYIRPKKGKKEAPEKDFDEKVTDEILRGKKP